MLKKIMCASVTGLLLTAGVSFADHLDSAQILKEQMAKAKAKIQTMDTKTLRNWIDGSEKDFILLDIREPNEVSAAKIDADEAMTIPRGLVEFVFTKKVKDHNKPVVVYCKAGSRGALTAAALKDLGYKNVYNLDGGILKWINEGHPVNNFFGEFEVSNFDSNFDS